MNLKKLICIGFVSLLGISLIGQEKPEEMPPVPPGFEIEEFYMQKDQSSYSLNEIIAKAEEYRQKGDSNLVAHTMQMGLDILRRNEEALYDNLLTLMIEMDNVEGAYQLTMDAKARAERPLREYFYRLVEYYKNKNDYVAMGNWLKSFAETQNLPGDLNREIALWQLKATKRTATSKDVLALLDEVLKKYPIQEAMGMADNLIADYKETSDFAGVDAILNKLNPFAKANPDVKSFIAGRTFQLVVLRGNWKDCLSKFKQLSPDMRDDMLSESISVMVSCAKQAGKVDVAEKVLEFVVKSVKNKNNAWKTASRQWIELAKEKKSAREMNARLEQVSQNADKDSLSYLLYLFNWYSYCIMADANKEDLLQMIRFGEELEKKSSSERDKSQIRSITMQAYFLAGDYDKSLELLKQQLPEMEEEDGKTSLIKVQAHVDMEHGRYEEALVGFTKFMQIVKKWEKPEMDPLTGMTFTKEMCLGLNTKRIGDIYIKMNKPSEAQKAYHEALSYYEKAEKNAKPDGDEATYIKEKKAELTGLLKK
jgi:hypothetical protein